MIPIDLDELDKKILNRIQTSVPLDPEPFKVLGQEFGISEDEMLKRVEALWDKGVVRRLGPIINYPAWEMSGALVAANMDPDKKELLIQAVNDYPEITHAYLRDHQWNFWFTVITETDQIRDEIIQRLTQRTGLKDVRLLKRKKSFKLNVNFKL